MSKHFLLLCALAIGAFIGQPSAMAKEPDKKPLSRIAFGACARQNEPQPIWDKIISLDPQLFLLIGDNIYADTRSVDVLRAKYAQLGKQPGFQRMLAHCPLLAVWDDHDYGENDAGVEFPLKRESQRVFLDFFKVPHDSPRRKHEGVYYAERFGPPGKTVQIILLDTRYFRSPLVALPLHQQLNGPYTANNNPGATVLGQAQWQWLKAQLLEPAEVRIIVSSVQVVAEDHHWEKWMNFPHERRRLFNLLRDTRAGGVLFISGDRHLGELSMMDAGVQYPTYDLTSSGLNSASHNWRPYETNRHRVGTMNWGDNFGMIEIEWDAPDPRIRLQIRDQDGDIAIQRKIFLSTIQPKRDRPAVLPLSTVNERATPAPAQAPPSGR